MAWDRGNPTAAELKAQDRMLTRIEFAFHLIVVLCAAISHSWWLLLADAAVFLVVRLRSRK